MNRRWTRKSSTESPRVLGRIRSIWPLYLALRGKVTVMGEMEKEGSQLYKEKAKISSLPKEIGNERKSSERSQDQTKVLEQC